MPINSTLVKAAKLWYIWLCEEICSYWILELAVLSEVLNLNPLACSVTAVAWFRSLNTGVATDWHQPFLSSGKDNSLDCMTGMLRSSFILLSIFLKTLYMPQDGTACMLIRVIPWCKQATILAERSRWEYSVAHREVVPLTVNLSTLW